MSAKVRPSVTISLDKERHLLLDLNAMVSFQEATGKNLFKESVAKALARDMSPMDLRALLWACLLHEDEALTLKQVGSWIHAGNTAEISAGIMEAWSKAIPEVEAKQPRPLAKSRRAG